MLARLGTDRGVPIRMLYLALVNFEVIISTLECILALVNFDILVCSILMSDRDNLGICVCPVCIHTLML